MQKDLKRHKGARNMLLEFATAQELDEDMLNRIEEIIDLFQRQKRFITKMNNTTNIDSNKQIAKDTKEQFDILHTYTRNQIMELMGGDIQSAYNYLVELMHRNRCTEATVWALLDDTILTIVPAKTYKSEVAA